MSTQLAFALRDEALEAVTEASDEQDVAVVDQAILNVAQRGVPFSANDVRPLLPRLRSNNLVGARMNSLRMRRLIVKIGEVVSTDPGTHGKKIGLYVLPQRASGCGVSPKLSE